MAGNPEVQEKTIRVMIVDDHPTVREGLAHRISTQEDMMICGQAADGDEALRMVSECEPEVMIIDIGLKHGDGLDLVKTLRERHRTVKALVHSMYDENVYADRSLRAGAMGYVNKEADPEDVLNAIRRVHGGQVYLSEAMAGEMLSRSVGGAGREVDPIDSLTNRQLEVLRLVGEGKTTAQIAEKLYISAHTVETHRDNIKRKLNVTNISELTRFAVLWLSKQR